MNKYYKIEHFRAFVGGKLKKNYYVIAATSKRKEYFFPEFSHTYTFLHVKCMISGAAFSTSSILAGKYMST